MNITEKDNKAEVISHACEIIDSLQLKNQELQQRQRILFAVSALLLTFVVS